MTTTTERARDLYTVPIGTLLRSKNSQTLYRVIYHHPDRVPATACVECSAEGHPLVNVPVRYVYPERFTIEGVTTLGVVEDEEEDAEQVPRLDSNDLWLEYLNAGACGLCGQSGKVDTRGRVKSPAGEECGVLRYCICPNGRWLKQRNGDNDAA